MKSAPFPHDLVRLQAAWNRTYDDLAAPRPTTAHTQLRRRLLMLSTRLWGHPFWHGPGQRAGRACAVAQSGPCSERGCAVVNRRPAHLTGREEQILRCIRQTIADRGEGPTLTEIGTMVGLRSKGTVAYHLRNLEERGALVRDGHGSRIWRPAR